MAFTNLNECHSRNYTATTAFAALDTLECSEVIVINKTGQGVHVNHEDIADVTKNILLDDNDTFTFRGLTNADQLSAQTVSGTGTLYYRTQFYSQLNQVIG